MAYVRPVMVPRRGKLYGPYYELVRSVRLGPNPNVRQVFIRYLGKNPSAAWTGPGQPPVTMRTKDNVELHYVGKIGGVDVWADKDVKKRDLKLVEKSINDLTPEQKKDIKVIELIGKKAPQTKQGRLLGYYEPEEHRIRIYGVNAKVGEGIESVEGTIMHEAGHNTYQRSKSRMEDEMAKMPKGENAEAVAAYKSWHKAEEKRQRLYVEGNKTLGDPKASIMAKAQAQSDYDKAAKESRKKETAMNEAFEKADFDKSKTPYAHAYAHWQKASSEEGHMTRYSQSYNDIGERGLSHNENYAEANALFTGYRRSENMAWANGQPVPDRSGAAGMKMTAREARLYYPKTYDAWKEMRDLEGY